jgi:integrase
MNTQNRLEAASVKEEKDSCSLTISGQSESEGCGKIAKQLPNKKTGGVGKNSANYWITRLIRPVNSRGEESPHYSIRTLYKGRRGAFSTGTGNKEAAAKIAAGIYNDILAIGWDATLAKHRPTNEPDPDLPAPIASVGGWIEAARKVSEANASTFNCYSCSLRKIVADILAVERTKKRFGPRTGGAAGYRSMIDATGLDALTPSAVQKWRLEYVKRAKNPAEERSRMTSCNSTIRQARSLFAAKIVKFLPDLRLPDPMPFHEVEFFPRQSAKYFSRIDAKTLLQEAHGELFHSDPPAFLAMLLAMSAGLRKGEIDSLQWHQVDFTRQLIRVESTEAASLKTADSRDEVAVSENTMAILRGFHAKKVGAFVIEAEAEESGTKVHRKGKIKKKADLVEIKPEGASSGPKKWGQHYRAGAVFDKLNAWLRKHGVTARKPLHELRKELGALVTAEHGIYAASRVLRHSDVSTTARHYTDLKTRPVIDVGGWLTGAENIEQFPTPQSEPGRKGKAATARKGRAA